MRLYRFEHIEGKPNGPYNSPAEEAYSVHGDMRSYDRHPSPSEDGIAWDMEDRSIYTFGFRSKAQLKRWFSSAEGRCLMEANDCPPWEFECPKEFVLFGKRQVAFIRKKAVRVHQLDPSTLEIGDQNGL